MKTKMKIKHNLIALILLPLVIFGLWYIRDDIASPDTVRAFGHLTVDLGVPSGDPVFVVNNMLPGDCVTRAINVSNGGTEPSSIAVRSDNETDLDFLSRVLIIHIEDENENVLYEQTLEQFFIDSDSLDGVPLTAINDGENMDYFIEICFEETAENEYQNTEVIFDLVFGEVITDEVPEGLPEECLELAGDILFVFEGTEGDDEIDGTRFGDLIIGKGGKDELDGSHGNDCIVGGDGDDTKLDGSNGFDVILGGSGNDRIKGGSHDDVIYAGPGDDDVDGDGGNDLIYGGGGEDVLDGGSGDDEIYGEGDNDELEGGAGNDYLNGGDGTDECDGEVMISCEV
jgi:hypothetical protein